MANIKKKKRSTRMVSLSRGSELKIADMISFKPGILFTALSGFNTLNARKLWKEIASEAP